MGKFRQISKELWPLIDVRNWFSRQLRFRSLPGAFLTNFLQLGIRVDIGKECLGIADG